MLLLCASSTPSHGVQHVLSCNEPAAEVVSALLHFGDCECSGKIALASQLGFNSWSEGGRRSSERSARLPRVRVCARVSMDILCGSGHRLSRLRSRQWISYDGPVKMSADQPDQLGFGSDRLRSVQIKHLRWCSRKYKIAHQR